MILYGVVEASKIQDQPCLDITLANDNAIDINASSVPQEGWRVEMSYRQRDGEIVYKASARQDAGNITYAIDLSSLFSGRFIDRLKELFTHQKCLVFHIHGCNSVHDDSEPVTEIVESIDNNSGPVTDGSFDNTPKAVIVEDNAITDGSDQIAFVDESDDVIDGPCVKASDFIVWFSEQPWEGKLEKTQKEGDGPYQKSQGSSSRSFR